MADRSKTVVYVALIGNLLIAISKFIVAIISGSSSMMSEAIHSTVDTSNELLMLVGMRRAKSRGPPSIRSGTDARYISGRSSSRW